MAAAIAQEWRPTFARDATSADDARRYWREHGVRWDFSECELTSVAAPTAAANAGRPSAPGPDEVRYSAWVSAGLEGARVLHRALVAMASGVRPPIGLRTACQSSSLRGPKTGTRRMSSVPPTSYGLSRS